MARSSELEKMSYAELVNLQSQLRPRDLSMQSAWPPASIFISYVSLVLSLKATRKNVWLNTGSVSLTANSTRLPTISMIV